MEIKRITEIEPVLECIPFEQEIRNKGRDKTRISKMILFVKDLLPSPLFGYWIAYDEGKVVGYTIAMISLIPSIERLVLWRMVAKNKDLKKQFEDILTNWAKEYKIKTVSIIAYSESTAKALERLGWKQVSINLERSI